MKRIFKIIIIILLFLSAFYFIFLEYKKIYSKIDTLENSLDKSDAKIARLYIAYDLLEDWKTAQINHNKSQNGLINKNTRQTRILENKITELENKLPKKTGRYSYSEKWLNLSNWRLITEGMSERQVLDILGEPNKRDIDIYGTNFYYKGFGKSGFVQFVTSGVAMTREPNF